MSFSWPIWEADFFYGVAWGIGIFIPLFFAANWMVGNILSHPTVKALSRVADRITKKGDDGGIWGTLIKEGLGFLKGPQQPPTE